MTIGTPSPVCPPLSGDGVGGAMLHVRRGASMQSTSHLREILNNTDAPAVGEYAGTKRCGLKAGGHTASGSRPQMEGATTA
jgi:hypothetical protein